MALHAAEMGHEYSFKKWTEPCAAQCQKAGERVMKGVNPDVRARVAHL